MAKAGTPWNRFYAEVPSHPKLLDLAEMLGISPVQAVGHIACLWCFTTKHAPDGNLADHSVNRIERAMMWDGERGRMVHHLIELAWLDRSENGDLLVHDWLENGAECYREALRKRTCREQRKHAKIAKTKKKNASADATRTVRVRGEEIRVKERKTQHTVLPDRQLPETGVVVAMEQVASLKESPPPQQPTPPPSTPATAIPHASIGTSTELVIERLAEQGDALPPLTIFGIGAQADATPLTAGDISAFLCQTGRPRLNIGERDELQLMGPIDREEFEFAVDETCRNIGENSKTHRWTGYLMGVLRNTKADAGRLRAKRGRKVDDCLAGVARGYQRLLEMQD